MKVFLFEKSPRLLIVCPGTPHGRIVLAGFVRAEEGDRDSVAHAVHEIARHLHTDVVHHHGYWFVEGVGYFVAEPHYREFTGQNVPEILGGARHGAHALEQCFKSEVHRLCA